MYLFILYYLVGGYLDNLPESCKNVQKSSGVKINGGKCVSLGNLETEIVVPSDLEEHDQGIRIGYINGEKVKNHLTRMFTMDFICDEKQSETIVSDLMIRRDVFYHFTVKSSFACNITQTSEKCLLKPYPNSYAGVAARPIPKWFDDVKFGIFIHWSIFSVPAYKSEWYYKYLHREQEAYVKYHNKMYGCSGIAENKFPCNGKRFNYDEFADMFQAQLFDPTSWANLFKKSGAKYVVYTSKHHDGFCNYPSPQHYLYNSVERGPHRDLVGDLTKAVKAAV